MNGATPIEMCIISQNKILMLSLFEESIALKITSTLSLPATGNESPFFYVSCLLVLDFAFTKM